MTDHTLHGNHDPCPACAERRAAADLRPIDRDAIPCNLCAWDSFLPISDAEIVARAIAEARRSYWPAAEARWALRGKSPRDSNSDKTSDSGVTCRA